MSMNDVISIHKNIDKSKGGAGYSAAPPSVISWRNSGYRLKQTGERKTVFKSYCIGNDVQRLVCINQKDFCLFNPEVSQVFFWRYIEFFAILICVNQG